MDSTAPESSGTILNVQRLSTEDGPGLRTTVFYKGCPLQCAWCHNPESIAHQKQLQWLENRCIGCGTCLQTCPAGCLRREEDGLIIRRESCTLCGLCVEHCPGAALEMLGKTVSPAALVRELAKDRVYFQKSGGGVTLSGGEPTQQAAFTLALLRGLKLAGLPAALDTCGLCARSTLEQALPLVDVVLYDLKLWDDGQHRQWTGQSNRIILENLAWLARSIRDDNLPVELWIRTPLIPGVTDTPENITAIGRYLGEDVGAAASRWELCAFNNLCRDKYRRLGMDWAFKTTELMAKEHLAEIEQIARQSGFGAEKTFVTGASKVELEKC
jgi:pyruvate formate lyase activating enzyme